MIQLWLIWLHMSHGQNIRTHLLCCYLLTSPSHLSFLCNEAQQQDVSRSVGGVFLFRLKTSLVQLLVHRRCGKLYLQQFYLPN